VNDSNPAAPNLWRRLGCIVYESITIAALLLLASAVATAAFGPINNSEIRTLHQLLELGLIGLYFLWCWTHGGQTLAMKTWRISVVNKFGQPLKLPIALLRFLLACAGLLMGGLGLWWALIDSQHRYLHDRLAHTRLITIAPARPPQ